MFEITVTPTIITLLAVIIAAIAYILAGMNRYIASVRRHAVLCNTAEKEDDGKIEYPSASIIVYAYDDAENLEKILPQLLTQDYPARMEVIIVNDGAPAGVGEVVARLESRFSNLYMTFVPDNSRNLSRRKLALTLGIKAARFETVVLTCGNCRVLSDKWLRQLVRPIALGKEISIGYSYQAVIRNDDKGNESFRSPLSLWKSVDTMWNTTEYLSWAIAGRPYRGTCNNLAYRRAVFFRNKGFSKSLSLKYGDDDIFVNEVSTRDNTAVELSRNSMIAVIDDDHDNLFKRDRLKYGFTSRFLPAGARRLFASSSFAWWLAVGCATALSIIGWPSVIPLATAIILTLILWITTSLTWRRTSRVLRLPFGWGGILVFPLLMMFHPVQSLYYAVLGRRHRSSNYTWS